MRVLSLFDGISCARVSLERAEIDVETYYASEIEKNAMKISAKNYPDIIQIGSVVGLAPPPDIDLLIGGSPCTDLSIAKKDRKGLEGDKSCLFWEYVRILRESKPKWFILENVASMPKKDKDIITKELGVEPVLFNASLVSAQCRKRLFWTNIPFELPEDRGILLKDILQPDAEVDERMVMKGKAYCLTATYSHANTTEAGIRNSVERKQRTMVKIGYVGDKERQTNRVYSPEGKAPTQLKGSGEGGPLPTLVMKYVPSTLSIYIPDGKSTAPVRTGAEIRRKLKNGVRADNDPDADVVRRIELRNDDKCGTLTTVQKDNHIVQVETSMIRKLTPIECERLQSLPDNYTEGIAMTHRYRCLGNAFNVEVVACILRGIHHAS